MAFDRRPDGGKLNTFVGYDAQQAGRNAADALAKAPTYAFDQRLYVPKTIRG